MNWFSIVQHLNSPLRHSSVSSNTSPVTTQHVGFESDQNHPFYCSFSSFITSSSAELSQIHHSFSTWLHCCTRWHVLRSESCQSRTCLWESVFSAADWWLHLWQQKKPFQSLQQIRNHRSLCGYIKGDRREQNGSANSHKRNYVLLYCEQTFRWKPDFDYGNLFWKMRRLCRRM